MPPLNPTRRQLLAGATTVTTLLTAQTPAPTSTRLDPPPKRSRSSSTPTLTTK